MDEVARAHRLLALSFGLAWIAIALIAAPGPAAWVALSGDEAQAGVFFGVFSLAAAAGAAVGGRLMDRYQRRRVLAGAHLAAAVGFGLAGFAYATGSLALFAVATVLLSAGIGAIYLTRLAAGEMFPQAERARAVARLQVMATFGAILGPLLLIGADPLGALLGRDPRALVWFIAPPLHIAAAFLILAAAEPLELAKRVPAPTVARARDGRIPRAPLVAGVAALLCANAAMVTIMGVTGAALHRQHEAASAIGIVFIAHFVGMFALSTVVGRIADRAGRRTTILVGLATLAVGGAGVAFLPGALGLAAGLLLVGLGWSFAYIGGTVLVTDVVPVARRARVLGATDFSTSLLSAAASFAGGWWYGGHGLASLGLISVAVAAIPLVLALPLRERSPGHYDEAPSPSAS